jgi:predicted ester cyclase
MREATMDDSPISIVRAYVSGIWDQRRVDLISVLLHPEYAADGTIVGHEWVRRNVDRYHTAFPDFRVSIVEHCAEGDRVATLMRLRGTQTGPWRSWKGIPATGRTVDFREAAFWRVQEGLIVSASFVADAIGVRIQLGQIPHSVWTGARLVPVELGSDA